MKNKIHFTESTLIISTYNWPEALDCCLQSVMNQSIAPSEIIIADDGSAKETSNLIDSWKKRSPIPIIHVWHPDKGFRLSEIRNKAILRANFPYIIQIDGDIILERHFIEDHLSASQKSTFLCGSRVTLTSTISDKLLNKETEVPNPFQIPLGFFFNSIRVPILSRFFAQRYRINKVDRLRGCNMSFWKEDLLSVNGYNEDMTGWGPEDKELAVRLINTGIEKRSLKFLAVAYHLFHTETNKDKAELNRRLLKETFAKKIKWTENGIKKQLQ